MVVPAGVESPLKRVRELPSDTHKTATTIAESVWLSLFRKSISVHANHQSGGNVNKARSDVSVSVAKVPGTATSLRWHRLYVRVRLVDLPTECEDARSPRSDRGDGIRVH